MAPSVVAGEATCGVRHPRESGWATSRERLRVRRHRVNDSAVELPRIRGARGPDRYTSGSAAGGHAPPNSTNHRSQARFAGATDASRRALPDPRFHRTRRRRAGRRPCPPPAGLGTPTGARHDRHPRVRKGRRTARGTRAPARRWYRPCRRLIDRRADRSPFTPTRLVEGLRVGQAIRLVHCPSLHSRHRSRTALRTSAVVRPLGLPWIESPSSPATTLR